MAERPPAARGRTTVLPRALHALAVQAALEVPGSLRHASGLGRLAGSAFPDVDVRALPACVDAQVRVALEWPCEVAAVTARIRRRVRRALTELTEVPVTRVDVHVGAYVPTARAGTTPATPARRDAVPPAPRRVLHPSPPPPRRILHPAPPAAHRVLHPHAPERSRPPHPSVPGRALPHRPTRPEGTSR